jgi:hypothetical protein
LSRDILRFGNEHREAGDLAGVVLAAESVARRSSRALEIAQVADQFGSQEAPQGGVHSGVVRSGLSAERLGKARQSGPTRCTIEPPGSPMARVAKKTFGFASWFGIRRAAG